MKINKLKLVHLPTEDKDHYCSGINYNPECYGLEHVATYDYHHHAYEFDLVSVWRDKKGRLWVGEDSGYFCSCPTPFERHKELDRLWNPGQLDSLLEARKRGEYNWPRCCFDPVTFDEFTERCFPSKVSGFASDRAGQRRFRLFHMFADGTVQSTEAYFATRGRARSAAQASPWLPGQVNWGTAWGYPESAITPLFRGNR